MFWLKRTCPPIFVAERSSNFFSPCKKLHPARALFLGDEGPERKAKVSCSIKLAAGAASGWAEP
jgi:hypothetical protein